MQHTRPCYIVGHGLSTQQTLDVDPRTIQQMNFIGNLDRAAVVFMFFILEEAKENVLEFSQGTVKALLMCCTIILFNLISI